MTGSSFSSNFYKYDFQYIIGHKHTKKTLTIYLSNFVIIS